MNDGKRVLKRKWWWHESGGGGERVANLSSGMLDGGDECCYVGFSLRVDVPYFLDFGLESMPGLEGGEANGERGDWGGFNNIMLKLTQGLYVVSVIFLADAASTVGCRL